MRICSVAVSFFVVGLSAPIALLAAAAERPDGPRDSPQFRDARALTKTFRDERKAASTAVTKALPFYSTTRFETRLLMMNNFAEPVAVEVAVESRGKRATLGSFEIDPSTHQSLELGEALETLPARFAEGALTLSYQGDSDMIQAWAVLELDGSVTELTLEDVTAGGQPLFSFWDARHLPGRFVVQPVLHLANFGKSAVPVRVAAGHEGEPGRFVTRVVQPRETTEVAIAELLGNADHGWIRIQPLGAKRHLVASGLLLGEAFLAGLPILSSSDLTEVPAGGSKRIDIEQIARSGEENLLGRTLDPDYRGGFLQWTARGQGGWLVARTEARPRDSNDAFGFNCWGCCWEIPWGELIPSSATFPAGSSSPLETCIYVDTCTGVMGPWYIPAGRSVATTF